MKLSSVPTEKLISEMLKRFESISIANFEVSNEYGGFYTVKDLSNSTFETFQFLDDAINYLLERIE